MIRIDRPPEKAYPRAAARRSKVAVVPQRFLTATEGELMNSRSRWILSVAAVLVAGAMANAKDVVLQDGGVVLGTTDTPVPVPTSQGTPDSLPGSDPVQDSPEPATLTLLGLGGIGARVENAAAQGR